MPRTLRQGQRSELYVVDVASNEHRLMFRSDQVLFEAPNWLPDGTLVVNGNGKLFRVADRLEEIGLGGVPAINNDHVISPDGRTVYVSAADGHLYAVPIDGGPGRRVTNDRGPDFHHYLHGVSPDGTTLAYIGLQWLGEQRITNVWTIPAAGGADVQLTDDEFADDGSEYGPDGEWIYFNSERAGQAQLFRIRVADRHVEQLTDDERVNWFPHPSPDGSFIAYVSFPSGTEGHPADIADVRLRLLAKDGEIRELTSLFGGQGTMNVPSWSPDSSSFAYVAYPLDNPAQ
jgi:Tol biopolymer transport system component